VDPKTDRLIAARYQPDRRPVMSQSWDDLIFLHWACDAQEVQSRLPQGLFVDTFESQAHVSIVGFKMNHVRPFNLPAVPWLSFFNELNVRVYVVDRHGVPGVYFFSLDCDCWPAVAIARKFFCLNYVSNKMSFKTDENKHELIAQRKQSNLVAQYRWQTKNNIQKAVPGTLAFHLTERYNFFTEKNGQLLRGQVYHEPYELIDTDCTEYSEAPITWNHFSSPQRPPDLIHACRGVKIKAFSLVSTDA
jgi:uncharacterized protein YqjF (DUF2071 family)